MNDISIIKSTASESLNIFSEVHVKASQGLLQQAANGGQSLANHQSFTNGRAIQILSDKEA